MTSGEAKPRKGAKSAPARPANTAAMTKTTSLKGRGSSPEAREAALVLADRLERMAEGRADERPAEDEREHDAGGDQA